MYVWAYWIMIKYNLVVIIKMCRPNTMHYGSNNVWVSREEGLWGKRNEKIAWWTSLIVRVYSKRSNQIVCHTAHLTGQEYRKWHKESGELQNRQEVEGGIFAAVLCKVVALGTVWCKMWNQKFCTIELRGIDQNRRHCRVPRGSTKL